MSNDIMRLAGINSGYDTEAMIEKMLSTYQTKIDNQNKKLQKLTWQQDAYRDITSKLTSFKNKYFDILKRDTYLLSPSTFRNFKTTVTNKANPDRTAGINVITSSSSIEGNHSIKVSQTATATKLTGNALTPENFKLDMSKAAASSYTVSGNELDGYTRSYDFALDVKVGNVTKSIEFSADVAQAADGTINKDDFAAAVQSALNDKLEEAFGVTGKTGTVSGGLNAAGEELFVSVDKDSDGNLKFKVGGNADVTVTEKTGDFGMARASTSVAIAAQAAVTGKNSVSVTMNGVTKTVSFNGVSDTYFDSRNSAGNGKILAEFNELKIAAYKKEHDMYDDQAPTQEQLDDYTFTSSQAARAKNSEALQKALNDAFKDEGGQFVITGNGFLVSSKEFTIATVEGGTLGLTKASSSNKFAKNATLADMGIAGKNENISFKINGKSISVKGSASMDDLVKAVNNSGAGVTMEYSKLENKFVVTANDMGNGGDVEIEANKFTAALGLAADENTAIKAEIGRNAIFEIDGVEVYHNDNSYEIDGVTIEFKDAEIGSKYEIGVSKDFDNIKQTIKDFVEDYNKLVDDVYGYIDTMPARDSKKNLYEPLTDAEKEEMSEKEIEKWEEKAKTGILYNDSTVSGIMSKLRSMIYTSITLDDGSKFSLQNLGIRTSSYRTDDADDAAHGKLKIDEEMLDKAFRENPDAIEKLFTDTTNGVMSKFNGILDDAVRSTGTTKGSLIRKAGLEKGSTAKDNMIYRQMEQIQKRIKTLQDRYSSKEDYWWSVFTNLEKMMSNMNSQMSYMASYLGTNMTNSQQ